MNGLPMFDLKRMTLRHLLRALLVLLGLLVTFTSRGASAEEPNGEQIYRAQCASCHGMKGEGTEENYAHPLVGEMSLPELTELIDKTMPEGEPEKCVGPDAAKVATYVFDAFYSEAAQIRNHPPRIQLSRLTVRQYQNVVADLLGGFSAPGQWDQQRGLRGEYYNDRRTRRDKRVIERIDPTVSFQYGDSSPEPGKIGNEEFSMTWQGSVFAPETGEYEFLVRTENAARLWVNDTERPLIDRWVKSGNNTEHRGTIQLLGGRAYPLRLEFFKYKEKTASISLEWKRPNHAVEPVPRRCLSPNRFPEIFVVETPFPPDDRSVGYERGTSISKAWEEATTYAAIEIASDVTRRLDQFAGTNEKASDRAPKVREFCHRFAERAFRHPLTDEQKQFFVDRHFEDAHDPEAATKKVVLLVLNSPRFLYREVGEQDAFAVASRISFALWDSIPDKALWEAAAKNQLRTKEQIAEQARRMVSDLRTKAKVGEFLHQWLKLDHIHDLSKDSDLYPDFNEQVASDLRTSLELFLDDVVWSDQSDFRQLLLSNDLFVNNRLAEFYGIERPADASFPPETQFERVTRPERVGVLSHPYLLSGFAYHATTSPIHRGVFIARNVLGRSLKPPPEAVSPLPADLHPGLTTRERVTLQTGTSMSCLKCHQMINPLGFGLETFDAVGRLRTTEKDKPIDASGFYKARAGETANFTGPKELATFLVNSPEVHEAFVRQLFHYLVKQPIGAFGPERLDQLRQSFAAREFNMRELLVEIVTTAAFPAETNQVATNETTH